MRILAAAGADFAIFDLEHTAWDAGTLRTLFAAGRSTGVHTVTRVIRAQYPLIASALDAGSRGVMAPMLESRAEAELLVEGEERPVRAWDFVHFPPGTEHILVGSGDEPCVFLAVGGRTAGDGIHYPVADVALRHEAGVSEPATRAEVAYVDAPETSRGPAPEGLLADR
jgi:2-keto-3-deoxy-L-rhamnonate aldolase RhmA